MKTSHFAVCFNIALLSLTLTACGNNAERDQPTPPPPPNPLEETLEAGALTLEGMEDNALNPADTVLKFAIKSTTFDATASEVRLSVNGKPVEAANISVGANQISAAVLLDDGRNDIMFKAYDMAGRPVFLNQTVWAGKNKLAVAVVSADGTPVPDGTTVTLRLSDNLDIGATGKTLAGAVEFLNVPARTVVAEARTADNGTGVVGGAGGNGTMTLTLTPFNTPDVTENNDFSKGLTGYEFGSSPVVLIPHVEQVGPKAGGASLSWVKSFQQADRASFDRAVRASGLYASNTAQSSAEDSDAVLSTSGQGNQTLSRTFPVKKGTTSVSVRYRFITSEVPGGYFGSKYNDYYSATIRTKSGQSVTESNTMNALGLPAFDSGGSTSWRRLSLKTDKEGDSVQFDLTVANVADGMLDSQLVVDLIEEKSEQVTPKLAWDPNNGGLKLTWKVGPKALENAVNIHIHWSNSAEYGGRIGGAITTVVVPAGTAADATGERNIAGAQLHDNPATATHVIAAVDETMVGPVADVTITYGPNADSTAVSAAMRDAIKDGLRSAGAKSGSISRTAVKPADQARAMFQNLTRAPGPLSVNITAQLGIYADPGDAVVRVFERRTTGMTVAQAVAQAGSIQAAMTEEINAQGPERVSKHCADPSKISVADVPQSNFTASGRERFKAVAATRSRLLDENNVYHMEIVKVP